jgi:hypothetical protein
MYVNGEVFSEVECQQRMSGGNNKKFIHSFMLYLLFSDGMNYAALGGKTNYKLFGT